MYCNTSIGERALIRNLGFCFLSTHDLSESLLITPSLPWSLLGRSFRTDLRNASFRCDSSPREQNIAIVSIILGGTRFRKGPLKVCHTQKESTWMPCKKCDSDEWGLLGNTGTREWKFGGCKSCGVWSILLRVWNEDALGSGDSIYWMYNDIRNTLGVIRESSQSIKVSV